MQGITRQKLKAVLKRVACLYKMHETAYRKKDVEMGSLIFKNCCKGKKRRGKPLRFYNGKKPMERCYCAANRLKIPSTEKGISFLGQMCSTVNCGKYAFASAA